MAQNEGHSFMLAPALQYVKHLSLTPNRIVGHFATASAWWMTLDTSIVTSVQILVLNVVTPGLVCW